MKRLTLLFAIMFMLVVADRASATLTFSLTPSNSTLAPTGGTVNFTASVIGDGGEQFNGYDLFFDVTGVDLGVAGGPLTISNQTAVAFGAPFFSTLEGSSGRDLGFSNVNLFGSSPVAAPLTLFTFDATFGAAAAGSTFDFNFTPGAAGFGVTVVDPNPPNATIAVDVGTITFNNATVTVSAVPEPSSLAFLAGLCAVGSAGFRRRRR